MEEKQTEQKRSICATDMLLSLANKLPQNLRINEVMEEETFTIAFFQRLSDEHLAKIKEKAELRGHEDVFLRFSVCNEEKCKDLVEPEDFKNFDFSKIREIDIGKDFCYVLVTLFVA